MSKIKSIVLATIIASSVLSGCTRVETGTVGVVKKFNGAYSEQSADVGFHMTILQSIYPYAVREIPVELEDLKPQTKNNSSVLHDLDISIQYSVNPAKVPELAVKYNSLHHKQNGIYLPAYGLVYTQARSAAATAVAQFDAIDIASQREALEKMIETNLQRDLDVKDPSTFTVSRVTVSNLQLDSKIADSIRTIAESNNRKLVAERQLEIAKIQAEENRIRSQTLDEKILAEKQLEALQNMAKDGTVFVVPMDFKGIINAGTSK